MKTVIAVFLFLIVLAVALLIPLRAANINPNNGLLAAVMLTGIVLVWRNIGSNNMTL